MNVSLVLRAWDWTQGLPVASRGEQKDQLLQPAVNTASNGTQDTCPAFVAKTCCWLCAHQDPQGPFSKATLGPSIHWCIGLPLNPRGCPCQGQASALPFAELDEIPSPRWSTASKLSVCNHCQDPFPMNTGGNRRMQNPLETLAGR